MSNLARDNVLPFKPDLRAVEQRVADTDDGFMRVANELTDSILKADLTIRQMKIMLAIMRKTYGFNKSLDRITNTQIAAMTGIHHTHVCSAKRLLINRGLLVSNGSKIGINKHISQWDKEISQDSESLAEAANQTLANLANTHSPKQLNTKDNIQKTKDITNTPVVPTAKKASKPEAKSTQLPKDFSPSEKHQEMAKELGINLEREFTKFVDYNLAKGNKYKVWDAALNNWLRRSAEFSGRQPSRGVSQPSRPMNHIPEGFTG